jgi:hypothetical protein
MKFQSTSGYRWFAWPLVLSPLVLLLVLVSLAVHIRIGLGHWPIPFQDDYHSGAYRLHEKLLPGFFIAAIVALPIWLVLLCFRPLRRPWQWHLLQAGAYLLGWGLIALYVTWDPWRFCEWLAD